MTQAAAAAAESFNRRPMEQGTECRAAPPRRKPRNGTNLGDPPRRRPVPRPRPVLGEPLPAAPVAQERRRQPVRRQSISQRAKSNQCDQSPTSIAFSGATVTGDDDDDDDDGGGGAPAHIIFYGSLAQSAAPPVSRRQLRSEFFNFSTLLIPLNGTLLCSGHDIRITP